MCIINLLHFVWKKSESYCRMLSVDITIILVVILRGYEHFYGLLQEEYCVHHKF